MAITSQVRTPTLPGEALLSSWQAAGLLKPSVAKPVLMTVQKTLILRRLGRLVQRDQDAVATLLTEILGP